MSYWQTLLNGVKAMPCVLTHMYMVDTATVPIGCDDPIPTQILVQVPAKRVPYFTPNRIIKQTLMGE